MSKVEVCRESDHSLGSVTEAVRCVKMMDRLMERASYGVRWRGDARAGLPPLDVYTTDEDIGSSGACPGTAENVELTIEGDTVPSRADPAPLET